MKWISVKTKRPKIGADVLVFGSIRIDNELQMPTVHVASRFQRDKYWQQQNSDTELVKYVTHWMPLPENPE